MEQIVSTDSVAARLLRMIGTKEVTEADLDLAALFTLDAVANMIAGRNSEPGRILLDWARTSGALGANRPRDAGRLALVLGGLCHIHEMDDLHRASVVHPGCAVVPAVMALAATDSALARSGTAALEAVLHGFEAATRIGRAVGKAHYRIWHNTATCGPFGSAMAAVRLLGLDGARALDALGNAGTQAAGLWEFLDTGAMSKHLHAGRAAESGVVSAQLAQAGFSGAPHILEGARGFFAAMCPDGDPMTVLAEPREQWQIHQTSIKPWPSCRHTHPAIDAAAQLRARLRERQATIDDIVSVQADTYQAAIDLCDRREVDNTYAAKFSLQHCVAAALSQEHVDFDAFGDEARRALAPLRDKVRVRLDESFDRDYPARWGSAVLVELASGETFTAACRDARGDPEAPLDREAIVAKAGMLMAHGELDDSGELIGAILAMGKDGPVPVVPV